MESYEASIKWEHRRNAGWKKQTNEAIYHTKAEYSQQNNGLSLEVSHRYNYCMELFSYVN